MADTLLILARTGRQLAESAHRAGISVAVSDAFADLDTRRASRFCKMSHWDDDGPKDITEALNGFSQATAGLVYGSGLEACPQALEIASRHRPLHGNPASTLRKVNHPREFFAQLDALDIPHPAVRFQPPTDSNAWLCKRAASAGGGHVRDWTDQTQRHERDYFQRKLPGRSLSVTFLANTERAYLIGFNTQWCQPGAFHWCGAINRAVLSAKQQAQVQRYIHLLVNQLRLRGLNTLDFMLDHTQPNVLELNPRPGSSLCLYDDDFERGLLHWHLQAGRGHLPTSKDRQDCKIRACRIYYARAETRIPPNHHWPHWCHDIAPPNTNFRPGEPVCTITATGQRQSQVIAQLHQRLSQMTRQLSFDQQAA